MRLSFLLSGMVPEMQASQAGPKDHTRQHHRHGQGRMVEVALVSVYARHLDEHEPHAGECHDQDKPRVDPHPLPASLDRRTTKGRTRKTKARPPIIFSRGERPRLETKEPGAGLGDVGVPPCPTAWRNTPETHRSQCPEGPGKWRGMNGLRKGRPKSLVKRTSRPRVTTETTKRTRRFVFPSR